MGGIDGSSSGTARKSLPEERPQNQCFSFLANIFGQASFMFTELNVQIFDLNNSDLVIDSGLNYIIII